METIEDLILKLTEVCFKIREVEKKLEIYQKEYEEANKNYQESSTAYNDIYKKIEKDNYEVLRSLPKEQEETEKLLERTKKQPKIVNRDIGIIFAGLLLVGAEVLNYIGIIDLPTAMTCINLIGSIIIIGGGTTQLISDTKYKPQGNKIVIDLERNLDEVLSQIEAKKAELKELKNKKLEAEENKIQAEAILNIKNDAIKKCNKRLLSLEEEKDTITYQIADHNSQNIKLEEKTKPITRTLEQ